MCESVCMCVWSVRVRKRAGQWALSYRSCALGPLVYPAKREETALFGFRFGSLGDCVCSKCRCTVCFERQGVNVASSRFSFAIHRFKTLVSHLRRDDLSAASRAFHRGPLL